MNDTMVRARVDPELKDDAEEIFSQLGITTTDAIRMFLSQVRLHRGLPFPVALNADGGKNVDLKFEHIEPLLSSAHQRAESLGHDYLGVEHVFLALNDVSETPGTRVLANMVPPLSSLSSVMIDKMGKEAAQRTKWSERTKTPRLRRILNDAHESALAEGRGHVSVDDVVIAILVEKNSVPAHALQHYHIDTDTLAEEVREQRQG